MKELQFWVLLIENEVFFMRLRAFPSERGTSQTNQAYLPIRDQRFYEIPARLEANPADPVRRSLV